MLTMRAGPVIVRHVPSDIAREMLVGRRVPPCAPPAEAKRATLRGPARLIALSMPPVQMKANVRSGPQGREYDAIADRVAADRPEHVLDWGAGHGQVTARLLGHGIRVTAYDYEPDAPARAAPARTTPTPRSTTAPTRSRCPTATARSTRCSRAACSSTSPTRTPRSTRSIACSRPAAACTSTSCPTGAPTSSGWRAGSGCTTTASSPHDRVYTEDSARRHPGAPRVRGPGAALGEHPAPHRDRPAPARHRAGVARERHARPRAGPDARRDERRGDRRPGGAPRPRRRRPRRG